MSKMRGLRHRARAACLALAASMLRSRARTIVKRRNGPRRSDNALAIRSLYCCSRDPAWPSGVRILPSPRVQASIRSRWHPISATCMQAATRSDNPERGEAGKDPCSSQADTASDEAKEEAMMTRRTVYDHADWIRHKSSARHVRHAVSIFSSRVVHALGLPVFALTSFSAAIAAFNMAVLAGHLPSWVPLLQVSSLPFQLTAPALALLLVFRTNSSYGRFDEARKAWGLNVNRSMDLARQALTWMTRPADAERLKELLRHIAAFSYSLKHHLDAEEGLQESIQEFLTQDETAAIMAASHRPHYVLQKITAIIDSSELLQMHKLQMDGNLTQLHDVVGSCERIYRTPIPLSYTRLTSRFLVFWHLILPMALWDDCNWYIVPAVCFSSATLFCIEEVGVVIEEPFGILALGHMCITVRKNLDNLVASCACIKHQREVSAKAAAKG